ncbi:MAG TPA: hypothetical protein VEU11_16250, partial [Terriglobales bacterium]|nr:hypothetical protein [Terriglobales bacterium]
MRRDGPLVLHVGAEIVETQVQHRGGGKQLQITTPARRIDRAAGEFVKTEEVEPSNVRHLRITEVGLAVVAIIHPRFQRVAAASIGDVVNNLKLAGA